MKTIESTQSTSLVCRNPFRIARLENELKAVSTVEQIQRYDWEENTRAFMHATVKDDSKASHFLQMLTMALQSELGVEQSKPNGVRFYGHTSGGQDDSWRVWVVLTREFSAMLPTWSNIESDDETRDTFRAACAELWLQWGFDPAGSHCNEAYSPTGRMFSNGLCCYRAANGCVVLRQSGARDV